jgi:hypothetical protein
VSIAIDQDTNETLRQIGIGNIRAISGGRATYDTVTHVLSLPVSNGYTVTVQLMSDDTYTVQRTFKRGLKVSVKGERDQVYCDQIGEVAYRASCFRSYDTF